MFFVCVHYLYAISRLYGWVIKLLLLGHIHIYSMLDELTHFHTANRLQGILFYWLDQIFEYTFVTWPVIIWHIGHKIFKFIFFFHCSMA